MENTKNKLLLYERNPKTHNAMISMFLENGFEVFGIHKREDILANLKTGSFSIFICDCDDLKVVNTINNIQNLQSTNTINTILHLEEVPRDFIENMLDLGACGIILKPFSKAHFMTLFLKILKKIRIKDIERRRHIRVKPYADEVAQVNFNLPKIIGNIRNISMGGFSCDIVNKPDNLKDSSLLKNIHIKLNDYIIVADVVLLRDSDNIFAFKFQKIPREGKILLAKYIHQNLNRYIE